MTTHDLLMVLIVAATFLAGIVAGVILHAVAMRAVGHETARNFATSHMMFRTAARVLDDILAVGRRIN